MSQMRKFVVPAAVAALLAGPVSHASAASSRAAQGAEEVTQTCQTVRPAGETASKLLGMIGIQITPDTPVGLLCTQGESSTGTVVCGPFRFKGIISVPVREGACENGS